MPSSHLLLHRCRYFQFFFLHFCIVPAKDVKMQTCCNLQHFVNFEKLKIVRKKSKRHFFSANGAFAAAKQQGPERLTGPCGQRPQCLTLLSEPTRKLAVFQPPRLTNGALATAKQRGPEGRTRPAGNGPYWHFASFLSSSSTVDTCCLSSLL